MRTWTLARRRGNWFVKPADEPSFTDEELCEVIEAESVLDLLERWTREAHDNGGPSWQLEKETDTLLREHEARLSGEREGRDA